MPSVTLSQSTIMDTAKYTLVFLLIHPVLSWRMENFVLDFYNSESVNSMVSANLCKVMCKNEPCLAKMISPECEILPESKALVKTSPDSNKAIKLWVSDQIEHGAPLNFVRNTFLKNFFLQFHILLSSEIQEPFWITALTLQNHLK